MHIRLRSFLHDSKKQKAPSEREPLRIILLKNGSSGTSTPTGKMNIVVTLTDGGAFCDQNDIGRPVVAPTIRKDDGRRRGGNPYGLGSCRPEVVMGQDAHPSDTQKRGLQKPSLVREGGPLAVDE